MKAVYIKEFGGVENLEIREVDDPDAPRGTQVLVRVRAAGLNRADLLQRRGLYPAPKGYPERVPGLEFAGEVIEAGETVSEYKAGDRVFGITAGGAQAEMLLTDASVVAKIPENLSYAEAAAVPEAFITAHDAVFRQARLEKGETLLIHAVGSGVGLAALQLAKARGVKTFGTSRTAGKIADCRRLGLDEGFAVAGEIEFAGRVRKKNGGRGVDVILDLVGGAYFNENLESLDLKGRLLLVGLTAGARADFNLAAALGKRLTIIGTVLRSRTIEEKAAATRAFEREVVPLLASGEIKPNVDRIFPLEEIGAAHAYLESNASFGKVILEF